ncbi:MAG: hypothetical protein ACLR6B_00950 [Blautia sp.]
MRSKIWVCEKAIIYAFYNHPVVSVNFRQVSCEELLRILDEAMDFYNDPRVREKTEKIWTLTSSSTS